MQLLIIRHGRAVDRDEFMAAGLDDDERPLTEEGRARMRLAAAGLRTIVPSIGLLASSSLTRAQQTAVIVGQAFGIAEIVHLAALRPGSRHEELVEWLGGIETEDTVAVVGHNTHLSELAGFLLTGRADPFVEIRKGGAVMIDVRDLAKPGSGTLLWSLGPSHLRALAPSDVPAVG